MISLSGADLQNLQLAACMKPRLSPFEVRSHETHEVYPKNVWQKSWHCNAAISKSDFCFHISEDGVFENINFHSVFCKQIKTMFWHTTHRDPRSFACFYKYSHQQFHDSLSSPADYVEIAGLISLSAFLTESSPCLDYGKLLWLD